MSFALGVCGLSLEEAGEREIRVWALGSGVLRWHGSGGWVWP